MTDDPFQRPGSSPEPRAESWPYHSPRPFTSPLPDDDPSTAAEEPSPVEHDATSARAPAAGRRRGMWALVAVGVAGVVVGGTVAGILAALWFSGPAPVSITVDAFPEYVLGIPREDMAARSTGDAEALRQFDAAFAEAMPRFRFVHGGDGATVAYGTSYTLTIVDGRQALPLPSGIEGGARQTTPVLVSLDSSEVSCVFQPVVGLYDSAVLGSPADLTAKGRTDCVLNDRDRNLSLRLTGLVPGDATRTSAEFSQILENTHRSLTD